MNTDCNKVPVFTHGKVTFCQNVPHAVPAGSIYLLKVEISEPRTQAPLAGQFFMLSSLNSKTLLSRPISVYHTNAVSCSEDSNSVEVQFLILMKGQGTKELCKLKVDDKIELLGPLGNTFPLPPENAKVALAGGGIGVAPVAGLASILSDESYDFYASYKSGSYGLENIKAKNLAITTEDGSVGVHGIMSAVLNTETLKKEKYDVLYACGPVPMLSYLQSICKETGTKCYLSMESKMACGVGACLGCTIKTMDGNRRCCKDGPVFEGDKLIFENSVSALKNGKGERGTAKTLQKPNSSNEPDLSTTICGVHFDNPVIAASGTFGFGKEYETIFDINRLGGICSKGLTLEPKSGNSGIRLWETPSGLINSIGLENPGVENFIRDILPKMKALKPVCIANLSGHSVESYVAGARLLDGTDVDMIELNISCPNVKKGGMGFGLEPKTAGEVVAQVRSATQKPLIVKLSPNAPSVVDVALAVIESGADALSLCNTFQALAIDIEKESFVFDNKTAGLSGPAIKPIALRIVYDVCKAVQTLPKEKQFPVIGLGGISTWQDAVEFIFAGCSAVQVGTATFANPECMIQIIDGIKRWMSEKGYRTIEDFKGKIQK